MLSIFVAGAVGIGPTLAVLETAVLPLYEAPMLYIIANPASRRGNTTLFLCEQFAFGSAYNIF